MPTAALDQGRDAFGRRAWASATRLLGEADHADPLTGPDLELLATAAFLAGDDRTSDDAWSRGYRCYTALGMPLQAARCAFWLGFGLLNRGELAQGSGWLARVDQIVEQHDRDGVERGYAAIPRAHLQVVSGDAAGALTAAQDVLTLARQHRDADLATLALLVVAHSRLLLGATAASCQAFDEALVAVTAEEVNPVIAGLAYCAVVAACHRMLDLRRAREWTAALTQWCQAQPELVPYRGLCLVHRSQVLESSGAWADAVAEAERACVLLSGQPTEGSALYQLGELHRLRGEYARAEDLYRRANHWGHRPEPGLMLLRLAQGQPAIAAASAQRVFAEAPAGPDRAVILDACVTVLLAAERVEEARRAAEELADLAVALGVPLAQALAERAEGAVLLARGAPGSALPMLRAAWLRWRDLDDPYQGALTRLLIGSALRAVGDEDAAQMEFDAAHWMFDQVGAAPDLARADTLIGGAAPGDSLLTPRETEVLRLVAAGRSNRDVATELFLSEKTVARHLANIYGKLDISSRSAATAYAYEHHLV